VKSIPSFKGKSSEAAGICTGGFAGRLPRYPIPDDLSDLLPEGNGALFLDVGSNWGRWAIAAARQGYHAVGLDPSLEAVWALRRVSRQLGTSVWSVVGDARFLPFRTNTFDVVFAYSVLQHFDKRVAQGIIKEMARVCKPGGTVLAQMPHQFGLRQILNRMKQRITRDSNPFRIRYWSLGELRTTFRNLVGSTEITIDGFFSLNPRRADVDLLPRHYAGLVRISEFLKAASKRVPWLILVADSLWVRAVKMVGGDS